MLSYAASHGFERVGNLALNALLDLHGKADCVSIVDGMWLQMSSKYFFITFLTLFIIIMCVCILKLVIQYTVLINAFISLTQLQIKAAFSDVIIYN